LILVDTSIWIDYLRRGDRRLAALLDEDRVATHPLVIGELALGNLSNRDVVLANFQSLPHTYEATYDEVRSLVDARRLWGKGIGWIDAHLLASAMLSRCKLWSADKALQNVAELLGVRAYFA
jgi:predicted nucleic acid-binding protein